MSFFESFTALHTLSYEEILHGKGYGLEAPRQAIEIVHAIRHAEPVGTKAEFYPLFKKAFGKSSF